jgi:excisionase family DNA binding protein
MDGTVPAADREKRGYRIAEAARYMGVSPWFVELKIRSGELPALKLCRHYTILREDMDAFLNSQKIKTITEKTMPYETCKSTDRVVLEISEVQEVQLDAYCTSGNSPTNLGPGPNPASRNPVPSKITGDGGAE